MNDAIRTSYISIAINLALSLFKLFAGIFAASTAMVTDAIHSASDVLSTIIVIIGIRISSKKADADHPYGHERFECVAAILLSGALLFTGGMIGYNAVLALASHSWQNFAQPGLLAIWASLISIAVKEGMFWYTRYYAKKEGSSALMADAWHHRSDAMSSVGALIGILFARAGFLFMDSVAGLIICLFILKASLDIFRDAVDRMVDKSCSPELNERLRECISADSRVGHIDALSSRYFGNRIYMETEIALPGSLSLVDAHAIAESVHNRIEKNFPEVKHVTVHVNPL